MRLILHWIAVIAFVQYAKCSENDDFYYRPHLITKRVSPEYPDGLDNTEDFEAYPEDLNEDLSGSVSPSPPEDVAMPYLPEDAAPPSPPEEDGASPFLPEDAAPPGPPEEDVAPPTSGEEADPRIVNVPQVSNDAGKTSDENLYSETQGDPYYYYDEEDGGKVTDKENSFKAPWYHHVANFLGKHFKNLKNKIFSG